MADQHKVLAHGANPLPTHRADSTDILSDYPEARMAAFAAQNIPGPPADDDVPDEWLRVLEGCA